MFSTKFDGGSLEVDARKPDAKLVKLLLVYLDQDIVRDSCVDVGRFSSCVGGHLMPMETCLVMVGTLVLFLRASSFSLQGASMLLLDCFVSFVGLSDLMTLLNGCSALTGPRRGSRSVVVLPDFCGVSLSSGSSCVDVFSCKKLLWCHFWIVALPR